MKSQNSKATTESVAEPDMGAAPSQEVTAPAEHRRDISDRPVDTRTLQGHGVIRSTGVVARDGNASIGGPLAAINWWTTHDKEMLATEYDAVVGPLAFEYSRLVFSGEDARSISPADGPLLDHDMLAIVLYHSAESFTKLTGSETHLNAVPIKEAAVADGYSFGLHRGVIGCEDSDLPAFPAQFQGPVLVVLFSMPDFDESEVDESYYTIREAVAADGRASLGFASRLVGQSFHELHDGTRTFPFLTEGIDGTLLFDLEDVDDAEQILSIAAVATFLEETSANVAVTFGE